MKKSPYTFTTTPTSQNTTVEFVQEEDKKLKVSYTSVKEKNDGFNECDIHLEPNLMYFINTVRNILKKRRYISVYFYGKSEINSAEIVKFKQAVLENIFYYKENKNQKRKCLFELVKTKLI